MRSSPIVGQWQWSFDSKVSTTMTLADQLNQAKGRIRQGEFESEEAVRQGIILPVLQALNWPIFETPVVFPEYPLENRRIDYALCHPARKPAVFVEVKKIGCLDGADKQLFEYAFHEGVPIAVLTDGQEWSFFLPGEQGGYDERRVYKLDLLERETEEAVKRLERYLGYDVVCSGEALRNARFDYQNVAKKREIRSALPKAWESLLIEQNSLLLELLADKVEDSCGYRPDLEQCESFFREVVNSSPLHVADQGTIPVPTKKSHIESIIVPSAVEDAPSNISRSKGLRLSFRGNEYPVRTAKDIMVQIFKLLAKEDISILRRFLARKHGKKRRYLSQTKKELYPGRPDLTEDCSLEVIPGWWLGTNYCRRDIRKIISLALEVAGPSIANEFKVCL